MSAADQLRAWLKSPDRIFVPSRAERLAQGRRLGLSRSATQAVLASESELTRLVSGRVKSSRSAFRLRKFSEAEIDLGFINYDATAHGLFLLGESPPHPHCVLARSVGRPIPQGPNPGGRRATRGGGGG